MAKKVAINGFGRIGRNAFKILFDDYDHDDVEVVAINDLFPASQLAHLLQYDSTYGRFLNSNGQPHDVTASEKEIIVDGEHFPVYGETDPSNLPWRKLGVDVVIECTGHFVVPEKARAHINAGAKKVVLSAPAKGPGAKTIVMGVNDSEIAEAGDIISNASCTTNCIAPIMSILESEFGVEKAMMTTAHSYTSDQRLLDSPHRDERRMRSAAENIIPTSTGASIAATEVIPSLRDKFGGLSLRVPTPVVSIADITAVMKRDVTVEEVNQKFRAAAKEDYYQGIIAATDEPLVSSDFRGDPHSSIVDLSLTDVVQGNLLKVVAWYDNEWGYSNRLVELSVDVAKML